MMGRKAAIFVVAIATGASILAVATVAGALPNDRDDVARARAATAKYHSLATAQTAGYGLFVDAKGIACIDMPGAGAMGIHYVNGALVGDPAEKVTTPEAVIYEPGEDGQLKLVALEYVVLKSAWDANHANRPVLFGQRFNFTPSPNRYGLPPFYSLHAWVWKHNPAGMFAMWNPTVRCPSSTGGDRGSGMSGMDMSQMGMG
jgi:hypothetical protein